MNTVSLLDALAQKFRLISTECHVLTQSVTWLINGHLDLYTQ